MKLCASLPFGAFIYRFGQKRLGRLDGNPEEGLISAATLVKWTIHAGLPRQSVYFEVGTGHKPVVPIGLFLLGAKRIITYDLYSRLDIASTKEALTWITANKERVLEIFDGLCPADQIKGRIGLIADMTHNPKLFLSHAGIEYIAPGNAADTTLPDNCIDCHFSSDVLEHAYRHDIEAILHESFRILKDNGVGIHFVELSDHFQHQDSSIPTINFLRYSDSEWNKIAGNQFAYCNRLRASDYLKMITDCGFMIDKQEMEIDNESLMSMKAGFMVHDSFTEYATNDLCTKHLKIAIKKSNNGKCESE